MKRKKKVIIGIVITLFSVLAYEFLCGKLFPFSPIIVGFTKYKLPHSIIYIQDGVDLQTLTRIDSLIPKVENFHELKFLFKPEIFIFQDSISFIRRSLSKARFCVYPNSRLFISPWAL